jgi:hypothetical protein
MPRLSSSSLCLAALAIPLQVAVHTGCSASKAGTGGGFTPADGGAPVDSGGLLVGNDGSTPNQGGCSDASKLVYVVSKEGGLYSFDPPSLAFTPIGHPACPTTGSPNSMAVDRTGTAWISYTDGTVWRVSTKDASCQTSPYAADQLGFHTFGMGYASNDADPLTDTLYIDDHDGRGLAKVDVGGKATLIAPFGAPLAGQNCELTGTGDGRLFGFFTTLPAQVAEIDKATGAVRSSQVLQTVSTGSEWAFSFWGGDFYLYTAQPDTGGLPQNQTTSDVTRYRPSDKSVSVLKQNIGFRIVGAGVSTCAPTTSPK